MVGVPMTKHSVLSLDYNCALFWCSITFTTFLINLNLNILNLNININVAWSCTPTSLIHIGNTSKANILFHHENHIHSPSLSWILNLSTTQILEASVFEPTRSLPLYSSLPLYVCTYVYNIHSYVSVYKFLCSSTKPHKHFFGVWKALKNISISI